MEHSHHHDHPKHMRAEVQQPDVHREHYEPGKEGGTHSHHEHSTHGKHAGHHTSDFLKRFWICLLLTVPILFLSHMIQQWLGFEWRFNGDKYVLLVLSSIVYFYGGFDI